MLRRLRALLARLTARPVIDSESVINTGAVQRVETFAERYDRAVARRLLGREVLFWALDRECRGTLAWVGVNGETPTVSSGAWADGWPALYMQAEPARLPGDGISSGLLVCDKQGCWYSPQRVYPVH